MGVFGGGEEETWDEVGGTGIFLVVCSSGGGEDRTWSRGRFETGESDGRVGDGELEKAEKGRLRIGELDICGELWCEEGGVGCEFGITLGGVCQESD